MIIRRCYMFGFLFLLVISGCTNNIANKEEFSGFISDYSGLQPKKLPSGTVLLHWRNPDLQPGYYKKIILDPTVFYPKPQVNDNVSAEILDTIKAHVDRRLKQLAKKNHVQVTLKPGKDVLRVRSAFTAIKITEEEFSAAELIPVMLVISAAELSVGGRDQDVTMIHEFEVVDSLSNVSMIKGIRKGKALKLANDSEKLTMEYVQPLMKKWGMDTEESFHHFAKLFAK